jgi:hypothetical protein
MAHPTPVTDPGQDITTQASDRPRYQLSRAATMAGVSQSTMERRLRSGAFPHAAQDDTGAWTIPVEDLLAAGFHLNGQTQVTDPVHSEVTPVGDLGRRIADLERQLVEERAARLVEQAHRQAAEQIAVEREKRAQTAERAMLMLESFRSPPAAAPGASMPATAAVVSSMEPEPDRLAARRWWRRQPR